MAKAVKRGKKLSEKGLADKNRELLAVLTRFSPQTIPEVLQIMESIQTVLLPEDGIRQFNDVYMEVTRAILHDLEAERWQSPRWMSILDVEFAKLYFKALILWLRDPKLAPPAFWIPLFEHRFKKGVLPVQFVMAGLNAHINRDLPIALARAFELSPDSTDKKSEAADFDRINVLLDEVELQAIQRIATGWAKRLCDTTPLASKAVMQFVSTARSGAWMNAKVYAHLSRTSPKAATTFVAGLDRVAEQMGRFFLLSTTSVSDQG